MGNHKVPHRHSSKTSHAETKESDAVKLAGTTNKADHQIKQNAAESERAAAPSGRSGRAGFDSRGNSIWEWKTEEEGKFSRDVSTQRLKKLEAPDLSLEDTKTMKKLNMSKIAEREGRGFDPYDRGAATRAGSSYRAKEEPAPKKPIKDLKRYDEWLKMKKRMAEKKGDDD